MKIVVLINDLFFMAKIRDELKDKEVKFCSSGNEIPENFDYLIIHLQHKDAFKFIEKYKDKCICFGFHTSEEFKEAKKVCKNTYPNSLFFKKLPEMIK
jgi:hypothetical protein